MKHRVLCLCLLVVLVLGVTNAQPPSNGSADQPRVAPALSRTQHPTIPRDPENVWLVPGGTRSESARRLAGFAKAIQLIGSANYADALPLLTSRALADSPLADYAAYYIALSNFRMSRLQDARKMFGELSSRHPQNYLSEAAPLREAEVANAQGDVKAALKIYEDLSQRKTTTPDDVLMRLARAAQEAGDTERATTALLRVYYEFPLGDFAALAATQLEKVKDGAVVPSSSRYALELGRAERLFGAKHYAEARSAFESLRPIASGDDSELVGLRLAECDFYLKRYRAARDGLQPYLENASRKAEALFFYLTATADLGAYDEAARFADRMVAEFGASSWVEEALNNLATHYIVNNEDDKADETFRLLYDRFPLGRYAERAAWKIGWWAYKNGRYADTVRSFEKAAAEFPRSEFRPSFLYWAARAHEQLGDRTAAAARYAIILADYKNSYYGRLVEKRVKQSGPDVAQAVLRSEQDVETASPEPQLPPNHEQIRMLLALALYDEALSELLFAQKTWGDSPILQATMGWVYYQRGELRRGINAIKRAYPQYLAAGGERLPSELLKVLFPVSYWPLIRKYSLARQLDPFVVAALIAQESTFTADARSQANAYGLMQLVPDTGRRYARNLKLGRFRMSMLTTPEPNIRMGTAFFSDLVNRFGGVHLALASYNAGEHRVARWMAERPGLDRDEWIDDIPFPETQGYVKKILGTADDYRRLYGGAGGEVPDSPALLKTLAPRPAAARSLNAHVMTSRAAVHASKSKSKRAVQAAKHRRNPKSPHGKPRRTHKP